MTFAAPPPGGASVSFGSSATATVTTDVNGIATSPAMTANGQAGGLPGHGIHTGAATSATFSSDQYGRGSQQACLHPAAG